MEKINNKSEDRKVMDPNLEETQARRVAKQVWPSIYRMINETFYFLLNAVKSLIKSMFEEIKNGG